MKKETGMSAVELLVVIAICTILVALAIPEIGKARDRELVIETYHKLFAGDEVSDKEMEMAKTILSIDKDFKTKIEKQYGPITNIKSQNKSNKSVKIATPKEIDAEITSTQEIDYIEQPKTNTETKSVQETVSLEPQEVSAETTSTQKIISIEPTEADTATTSIQKVIYITQTEIKNNYKMKEKKNASGKSYVILNNNDEIFESKDKSECEFVLEMLKKEQSTINTKPQEIKTETKLPQEIVYIMRTEVDTEIESPREVVYIKKTEIKNNYQIKEKKTSAGKSYVILNNDDEVFISKDKEECELVLKLLKKADSKSSEKQKKYQVIKTIE